MENSTYKQNKKKNNNNTNNKAVKKAKYEKSIQAMPSSNISRSETPTKRSARCYLFVLDFLLIERKHNYRIMEQHTHGKGKFPDDLFIRSSPSWWSWLREVSKFPGTFVFRISYFVLSSYVFSRFVCWCWCPPIIPWCACHATMPPNPALVSAGYREQNMHRIPHSRAIFSFLFFIKKKKT